MAASERYFVFNDDMGEGWLCESNGMTLDEFFDEIPEKEFPRYKVWRITGLRPLTVSLQKKLILK